MNGRRLAKISATLVSLIALAAFTLSFEAIRGLAETNGIQPQLAWLVPLIVDGAMVVFSVSMLQAIEAGEPVWWRWGLILSFTGVSIVFNVTHSNRQPVGIMIAALAPIALFATFETLMSQIKAALQGEQKNRAEQWEKRARELLRLAKAWRNHARELESVVSEQAHSGKKLKEAEGCIYSLENEVEDLKEKLKYGSKLLEESRKREEASSKKAEAAEKGRQEIYAELAKRDYGWQFVNPLAKDVLKLIMTGEGTQAEIASRYEVSESTVSRLKSSLNGGDSK